VLANLFELAPVVNSIKGGQIKPEALGREVLLTLADTFELYLITIMGLKPITVQDAGLLDGVISVLIELRKEAKVKKDFATSDAIRDKLLAAGVQLKDEKGGEMSWSLL
jgi:cysteinyl-tRNA synthetase